MADQYPYSMNYKKDPMAAFMEAFMGSLQKVAAYKMQQNMQDDSAAKRLAMEREYESQKQAQTEAAFARDPKRMADLDYTKAQTDKLRWDMTKGDKPTELEQLMSMVAKMKGGGSPARQQGAAPAGDWGAMVNPQSVPAQSDHTGTPWADPTDTADEDSILRAGLVKAGVPATTSARLVPKKAQELSFDEAASELALVNKDAEAQTLETNKIARERERDINLLMTSGRVKSRAEAEKVLADTDASKRLGDKPEAAPSEMKLFIDGYREANPNATKADVFAAYKEQKRGDVQAELEMRDALMKDRWYPTAYLDKNTGLPIIGDRAGTFRVGDVSGGVVPVVKPTEADKKTSSEINNIQEGIARIRTNYSKDFVGPIAGRYGGAKEMTIGLPPAQAEFYADVRSMKDALLRAKSGAQINEQEYRRLVKFLPDENSPASVFETRLLRFEKEMDSIIRGRANARQGVMPKPSTDLRPMFGAPPVPGTTIDLDSEIDSYIPGR